MTCGKPMSEKECAQYGETRQISKVTRRASPASTRQPAFMLTSYRSRSLWLRMTFFASVGLSTFWPLPTLPDRGWNSNFRGCEGGAPTVLKSMVWSRRMCHDFCTILISYSETCVLHIEHACKIKSLGYLPKSCALKFE